MSMRIVKSARRTDETEISLTLNLDGSGIYDVDTGCGFLNHMLELFSRHGRFDLTLACRGDVQVDYHHTVEDIAIVLGRAFSEALGDRAGINRYGTCTLPMDEALILAAVDISGRPAVGYALEVPDRKGGRFRHRAGGGIPAGLRAQPGLRGACAPPGGHKQPPYHRGHV